MSKHRGVPNLRAGQPLPDVHAAVLAGGTSRRFGSDKCLARFPGDRLTFLERVVAACRETASRVMVIAPDRPGLSSSADALVPDLAVDEGPLVGLLTALRYCAAPFLILAACDQPLLSGGLPGRLAENRFRADIVVFDHGSDKGTPFPCLLNTTTVLPYVEGRVHAGERSLKILFDATLELTMLALETDQNERARLGDIDTRIDFERVAASLPLGSGPVQ